MARKVHNKAALFFGLFLVLFANFSGLPFFDQKTYAAASYTTYDSMTTAEQRVSSYAFYLALPDCAGAIQKNISTNDTANIYGLNSSDSGIKKILDQTVVDVGYVAENYAKKQGFEGTDSKYIDGKITCRSLISSSFKLWGIANVDAATTLKSLGYSNSQSSCYGLTNFNGTYGASGGALSLITDNKFSFSLPLSFSDAGKLLHNISSGGGLSQSDAEGIAKAIDDRSVFNSSNGSYINRVDDKYIDPSWYSGISNNPSDGHVNSGSIEDGVEASALCFFATLQDESHTISSGVYNPPLPYYNPDYASDAGKKDNTYPISVQYNSSPSSNYKAYPFYGTLGSGVWKASGDVNVSAFIAKTIYGTTDVPKLKDKEMYYIYNDYYLANLCGLNILGKTKDLWPNGIKNYSDNTATAYTYSNNNPESYNYMYGEVRFVLSDNSNSMYSLTISGDNLSKSSQLIMWKGLYTTCQDIVGKIGDNSAPASQNAGLADITSSWIISSISGSGFNASGYPDIFGSEASIKINSGKNDTTNEKKTCRIGGLGWILCPILTTMASLADAMLNIFQGFLKTSPEILNSDPNAISATTKAKVGTAAYTVWKTVRNIANVIFVIFFLIIIFSQMTSFGISNYGIKKLLPRLIVTAILVNISFYICQIAVDISNVVGNSMQGLFSSIPTGSLNIPNGTWSGGNTWTNVVGVVGVSVAAGAAILWGALAFVIPALIGAIVSLLLILVLLVGRQAIIVLLAILSPLAFIAYMLPNTDKLFKKWKSTFMSMLLLYPIVTTIFGASALASAILLPVFASGDGATKVIGEIAANVILVVPLFLVPGLLKKSLDGIGGIGEALNKLSTKAGGALGKKGGEVLYENRRLGQFVKYQKTNSRHVRKREYDQNEANTRRALIQSGQDVDDAGIYSKWRSARNKKYNESKESGEFGDRSLARGYSLADAEDEKVLKSTNSLLSNALVDGKPLTVNQKKDFILRNMDVKDSKGNVVLKANDEYMQRAMLEQFGKTASVSEMKELVDASSTMSLTLRKTLVSTITQSGAVKKAPWFGGKTLGDIEQGTANLSNIAIQTAITSGAINPEVLLNGDIKSLAQLQTYAASTAVGSREREILKDVVYKIRTDDLYKNRVSADSDIDKGLDIITNTL